MSKEENVLYHYGIKGMKWGVRRYQNKDGTLTESGRKRYSENEKRPKRISPKTLSLITLSEIQAGRAFVEKNKTMKIGYLSSSLIAAGAAFAVQLLDKK